MEDQKEKEKIFSQLISQVITEAGNNFSIEEVKDFFAFQINSTRSLDKVGSLREVFRLLEKRYVLNWHKITPLHSLGELLGNDQIKEFVRCYKKMCLDEDLDLCGTCGVPLAPNPHPVPLNEHHGTNLIINMMNNVSVDSLNAALENVALSIGTNWGVLVRELGLKEIQIDKCIEVHPKDYTSQARMALKIWRQVEKQNASIERLDKALEARLCKIKGIGLHLKNRIVGIN